MNHFWLRLNVRNFKFSQQINLLINLLEGTMSYTELDLTNQSWEWKLNYNVCVFFFDRIGAIKNSFSPENLQNLTQSFYKNVWSFLSTTANYTVINSEHCLKKQTIFSILFKIVRHTCEINNLIYFHIHNFPRNAVNITRDNIEKTCKEHCNFGYSCQKCYYMMCVLLKKK